MFGELIILGLSLPTIRKGYDDNAWLASRLYLIVLVMMISHGDLTRFVLITTIFQFPLHISPSCFPCCSLYYASHCPSQLTSFKTLLR